MLWDNGLVNLDTLSVCYCVLRIFIEMLHDIEFLSLEDSIQEQRHPLPHQSRDDVSAFIDGFPPSEGEEANSLSPFYMLLPNNRYHLSDC